MTDDKDMCKDFEDNGAIFPKVLPEYIAELMEQVIYKPSLVEGTTTTLVVGVLPMGAVDFTLAVSEMACVDKRNFNAELGVKYCTEKCVKESREKLWELEGYHLAKTLAAPKVETTFIERMRIELAELSVKVKALGDFFYTPMFKGLTLESQNDLSNQFDIMKDYESILTTRIKKIEEGE